LISRDLLDQTNVSELAKRGLASSFAGLAAIDVVPRSQMQMAL
jgi:hypothetical protein